MRWAALREDSCQPDKAPFERLSVEIKFLESGVSVPRDNFLVSEINWPKNLMQAIPAIISCDGGAMAKKIMANVAESTVQLESVAKAGKNAW